MGKPRVWELMTVEEIRNVLKKTRTVILPLGVTEQHGYHLPLCTDTYDAYETAKLVSARTGAVVAPALPYSFSGGGLPGTINVSPQVMSLMVQEIITSIIQNGFKNIIIMLGHGGSENFLALKDALHIFLRNNQHLTDVVITFAPVWEFGKCWQAAFKTGDFHAGHIETSIMMYLGPNMVKSGRMATDVPRLLKLQRENPDNYQLVETLHPSRHVVPRIRQHPDIKVGVMGDPQRASAEFGRKIVLEAANGIAKLIRDIERKKFKKYREVKIKRKKLVIVSD
ncbi:MAG: creatininase family protein [Kiritimatiellia bacterium]|nr:creatininase family protein [Kiritimatiellia bacterium]